MKRLFLLAVFAVMVSAPVYGADTVTDGTVNRSQFSGPGYTVHEIDWLSSTTGAVTVTFPEIEGRILRISIKPDSGATSPTANYDMTLKDALEIDVLLAKGANLSQSATMTYIPLLDDQDGTNDAGPVWTHGDLDLAITNAGSENGGIIWIFVRKEED